MRRLRKAAPILALLLLPVVLVPHPASAQQEGGTVAADSAGAMRVIAAYINAVGGEKAIRSVTHQRGTVEVSMAGATLEIETLVEHNARVLIRTRMAGEIISQTGWDGSIGWTYAPTMGALPIEGPALDPIRETSDLRRALHEGIRSPTLLGASTFAGKPTVAVRMIEKQNTEVTKHFDPQTHLLVGFRVPAHDDPTDSVLVATADYRQYGPVKLPETTTVMAKGEIMVLKVLTLSHAPLDSAAFEVPVEVRALRPAGAP